MTSQVLLDTKVDVSLESIREVRKTIKATLQRYHVDTIKIDTILLGFTEINNNIVIHGSESASEVIIHLVKDASDLILTIQDDGSPFEMSSHDIEPPLNEFDPLQESGRGLMIVSQLFDRINFYSHNGENKTELLLQNCFTQEPALMHPCNY